ncbi:MAG TPA: hypothetical protein PK771_10870 [Spirochaetota bacterium]|nr:hypothetical protein [Spirochaetota bacterium]
MKEKIIFLFILTSFTIFSETFYLENGRIVEGTKEILDENHFLIKTDKETIKVKKESLFSSKEELFIHKKYWKRHFIEMTFNAGYSVQSREVMGFDIGSTFAYTFGITKYFAMGHGFRLKFDFLYYDDGFKKEWIEYTHKGYWLNFSFAFLDQFMFGDLRKKQIAFLFDFMYGKSVGGAIGLYYKGFVFKIGYSYDVPFVWPIYWLLYHTVTFDFGYKFSLQRKKK